MATRTTPEKVRAIMNLDAGICEVDPFIDAANELVSEIASKAVSPLTATRLELIERWLAAHFVALRYPQYISESIGDWSGSTGTQLGVNLAMTSFGMQAKLLDTTGELARLDEHIAKGKRSTVRVTWLGTEQPNSIMKTWIFQALFGD